MKPLCAFENHTYVTYSYGPSQVKGRNEIVGLLGGCLDRLLIKKELRKCLIIGRQYLGSKLDNGSYTGVLGMLERKQVDLYLKGEADYLHEDWLVKTPPMFVERLIFGQVIVEDDKTGVSYVDLLSNFKISLTLLVTNVGVCICMLFICCFIIELKHQLKFGIPSTRGFWQRFALVLSKFTSKRFTTIGIIVLSFNLFLWIVQLLVVGQIATNKVVVDTSELVKDEHDMFNSRHTACFFYDQQEMNMAVTSPTDNLLTRVFKRKTYFRPDQVKERQIVKNDRCLVEAGDQNLELMNSDLFMVSSELHFSFFLGFVSAVDFHKTFWVGKVIHEYNLVTYYSLRHAQNREFFDRGFAISLENGLSANLYECMTERAEMSCGHTTKIFRTLNEFVDDNAHYQSLVLNNFQTIFAGYFLICSLILGTFVIHHLIKWLKTRIF